MIFFRKTLHKFVKQRLRDFRKFNHSVQNFIINRIKRFVIFIKNMITFRFCLNRMLNSLNTHFISHNSVVKQNPLVSLQYKPYN